MVHIMRHEHGRHARHLVEEVVHVPDLHHLELGIRLRAVRRTAEALGHAEHLLLLGCVKRNGAHARRGVSRDARARVWIPVRSLRAVGCDGHVCIRVGIQVDGRSIRARAGCPADRLAFEDVARRVDPSAGTVIRRRSTRRNAPTAVRRGGTLDPCTTVRRCGTLNPRATIGRSCTLDWGRAVRGSSTLDRGSLVG